MELTANSIARHARWADNLLQAVFAAHNYQGWWSDSLDFFARIYIRLRVVLLSLSLYLVRHERNLREKKWLCEILGARSTQKEDPRISHGQFFLTSFFRVSLNGLGERGTTHRLDLHVQHIPLKHGLFTKWNHCYCMELVKMVHLVDWLPWQRFCYRSWSVSLWLNFFSVLYT